MKYKVGDKVRIRSDLVVGCNYDGLIWYDSMNEDLLGKTTTIKQVGNIDYKEELGWYIKEEMIECKVEEEKEEKAFITNFEHYKEDILPTNSDTDCIINTLRGKECKHYDDFGGCEECLRDSLYWLFEEYKEPIKKVQLTQMEYDILSLFAEHNVKNNESLIEFHFLYELLNKGHFKGVKETSMSIKVILDNCEVVE